MPESAIIKFNGRPNNPTIEATENDSNAEGTDEYNSYEAKQPCFSWIEDYPAAQNYREFGAVLAKSGDLYRSGEYGHGLGLVVPDYTTRSILTAKELAPIIVDRVDISVYLGGKPKGSMPTASHLNSMLMSEAFLSNFVSVDRVSKVPSYQRDFSLTQPGFNNGGRDFRVVYLGEPPLVFDSMDRIHAFLDVMDFASGADRTNTAAAYLTVMLRHHCHGALENRPALGASKQASRCVSSH